MKFLFEFRPIEDKIVLGKICFDILSQPIIDKKFSEDFCGIWIDGRNRNINYIEDLASIYSFYLYSKKLYPLLLFCYNNNSKLLEGLLINDLPISIIKISEINSHKKYSDFCKFELPFLIPDKYQRLLFLQTDSFLIKNGWEDYINSINVDYIGSAWLHSPNIEFCNVDKWYNISSLVPPRVGNGAISYRTLHNMRNISKQYRHVVLREMGTENKEPSEDLFYSYFTQLIGKLATVEQAQKFVVDPLTLEEYNKKSVFGGHFPVYKDRFKEKYLQNLL